MAGGLVVPTMTSERPEPKTGLLMGSTGSESWPIRAGNKIRNYTRLQAVYYSKRFG
jgi:hypothetical protein